MVTIDGLKNEAQELIKEAELAATRAYRIVLEEHRPLGKLPMKHLVDSNARSMAATEVLDVIKMSNAVELNDATRKVLLRRLKSSLRDFLNDIDSHMETIRVLNEVIDALEYKD